MMNKPIPYIFTKLAGKALRKIRKSMLFFLCKNMQSELNIV